MGFSLQLWHKFRHQFDGSGGGESVHLRCRGWGLLAVLLIVLQIAAPPAALAECGYTSCSLPCYCWTVIDVWVITTCGPQCWVEDRRYYCNTYPFGYHYCQGCFCYA